ncbi:hypothetical protein DFP72DRAFT_1069640 [Ephemerocybe angulata]|uniref:Uncharacterized protein n=1 Tax=Ephemerocybe angulata TaxID=980116 RepID=A0A8H6HUT8_9AGAR|nr:hypothetical protein DFP72DRAFT_1069640 [Tulosesus angulatus]
MECSVDHDTFLRQLAALFEASKERARSGPRAVVLCLHRRVLLPSPSPGPRAASPGALIGPRYPSLPLVPSIIRFSHPQAPVHRAIAPRLHLPQLFTTRIQRLGYAQRPSAIPFERPGECRLRMLDADLWTTTGVQSDNDSFPPRSTTKRLLDKRGPSLVNLQTYGSFEGSAMQACEKLERPLLAAKDDGNRSRRNRASSRVVIRRRWPATGQPKHSMCLAFDTETRRESTTTATKGGDSG